MEKAKPRWSPWPICITAYFTVAIIGCTVFVVYCSRHPADLVAADYYEQEVRYQGQIDRQQNARQRAQEAKVTYEATTATIRISLPPSLAAAQPSGNVQLYRPSAIDQDRQLKFGPGADGVQTIDARDLRPGLWRVRVSWTSGHEDFFLDQNIVVGPRPTNGGAGAGRPAGDSRAAVPAEGRPAGA